jgi:hypothetical protein
MAHDTLMTVMVVFPPAKLCVSGRVDGREKNVKFIPVSFIQSAIASAVSNPENKQHINF